jgi:predicted DNA-binding transcriptional regulator AlpA
MSKSKDLLTLQEVAQFYGLSVQSIRRRLQEAKSGKSRFPRPIFGFGRKALFHRRDIENFTETAEPGEAGQDG